MMKDGEYRWFRAVGGVLRDPTGIALRACGSLIDVHAVKLAEEELRLAALVYDESMQAMLITDSESVIIAINPAFTKLTGYVQEEILGKHTRILKSGKHNQEFYKYMWDAIIRNGQWQGEIWSRKKSGEIYPSLLTINTSYSAIGAPARRVALISDMTEQKKTQEVIWRQANFDSLTNLPNRRMFFDRLEQVIKLSSRTGMPGALILIDLDHFKEVNDTLGHDKGDILLKEVSIRLLSCCRETDTVGRLGGDEFTIILADQADISCVEKIAENILERVSAPYNLNGNIANISASIGIALFPENGTNLQNLYKNADQAMYQSKRLGRNQICFFNSAI
jgi:diguanylate cyclase (GGDEF)-like protein/PAS domain S-box-containing protein